MKTCFALSLGFIRRLMEKSILSFHSDYLNIHLPRWLEQILSQESIFCRFLIDIPMFFCNRVFSILKIWGSSNEPQTSSSVTYSQLLYHDRWNHWELMLSKKHPLVKEGSQGKDNRSSAVGERVLMTIRSKQNGKFKDFGNKNHKSTSCSRRVS